MSELRDAVAKQTELARFRSLFEGNPEFHGRGDHSPYAIGGSPNFAAHLQYGNNAAVGVYPIWRGVVHWGCVDLDDPDLVPVYNLQQALFALGIHSVVELSRSKGWHVWVFLEGGLWMRAFYMRRALLVACQIAEASAREVNPKQEELAEHRVGNYVRLPYPNRGAGGKQVFGTVGQIGLDGEPLFLPLNFEAGLQYAESKVNDYGPIVEASKLWKPPARKEVALNLDLHDSVERGLSDSVKERLKSLPLTRRIMEEGEDLQDRSRTLTHLGYLAQESGFTPSETLSILIEADLTWAHKYIERDHNDRELRRIVQRVFG